MSGQTPESENPEYADRDSLDAVMGKHDEPVELTEDDFIEISPELAFDTEELTPAERAAIQEEEQRENEYIIAGTFLVSARAFTNLALARDDYRERVRLAMLRSVHPENHAGTQLAARIMLPEERLQVAIANLFLTGKPVTFRVLMDHVRTDAKLHTLTEEKIRSEYCKIIRKFHGRYWIDDITA